MSNKPECEKLLSIILKFLVLPSNDPQRVVDFEYTVEEECSGGGTIKGTDASLYFLCLVCTKDFDGVADLVLMRPWRYQETEGGPFSYQWESHIPDQEGCEHRLCDNMHLPVNDFIDADAVVQFWGPLSKGDL